MALGTIKDRVNGNYKTYSHQGETIFGGIAYAIIVEILNGYILTLF